MALELIEDILVRITDDDLDGTNNVGTDIDKDITHTLADGGTFVLRLTSADGATQIFPQHLNGTTVGFKITALYDASVTAMNKTFTLIENTTNTMVQFGTTGTGSSANNNITLTAGPASTTKFWITYFVLA